MIHCERHSRRPVTREGKFTSICVRRRRECHRITEPRPPPDDFLRLPTASLYLATKCVLEPRPPPRQGECAKGLDAPNMHY